MLTGKLCRCACLGPTCVKASPYKVGGMNAADRTRYLFPSTMCTVRICFSVNLFRSDCFCDNLRMFYVHVQSLLCLFKAV